MADRVLDVLRSERDRKAKIVERIRSGALPAPTDELDKRVAEVEDLDAKIARHEERMNAQGTQGPKTSS